MKALLVTLLAAASLLAAPGGVGAQARTPSKVVFGTTNDVQGGFNGVLNSSDVAPSYFLTVLHGAFLQDDHGTWVKDLVSNARADSVGVSYTIRPDADWYWGGRKIPVTFRDFVYTLRQIDDPQNDVATRAGYSNLDPTRYRHVGDRRVTFFWRTSNCSTDFPCGPYADWPSLFSQLYPALALAGLDFNTMWTNCICGSDGKPVADGPFYLASHTPGQSVVLKANPYYHDRAKLAEVDFRILSPDPAVLAEAMRDGQVDAMYPSFAPEFLTLRATPGLTYRTAPSYALEQLQLREGSAPGAPSVTKSASNALLRAPWMRKAIMLALDRQAMIDAVYGPGTGLTPTNNLLFYPGEADYRPDFGRWNYNPRDAVAILRKHCTGGPATPDAATTKVWRCSGLTALFRYTWGAAISPRTAIEQVAKADLKAVGIEISERPLPSNLIFTPSGIPSGDFDLAEFVEFTSGDAGDWYDSYRCLGGQNWTGYCSHAVDRLLRSANGELDPEKRGALYQRADALMAAEVVAIPLFQKPGALISKSDLLGIGPNPGDLGPFWNIQDWHWKR
jgi:peptide/nickel transport system substrate-binding protein